MNVALCLYGLLGGKSGRNGVGGTLNPEIAQKHYLETLLSRYDVDVFIHSWSTEWMSELQALYHPKKINLEPQVYFPESTFASYGFSNTEELFNSPDIKIIVEAKRKVGKSDADIIAELEALIFRSSSRWLSTQRSIKLKQEYERETGKTYDFVVSSRFDIRLHKPIHLEALDQSTFYAALRNNREDFDTALYDLVFVAGNPVMDDFATIFDKRFNYSFRPPWASRQHVDSLGCKLSGLFEHNKDYELVRTSL